MVGLCMNIAGKSKIIFDEFILILDINIAALNQRSPRHILINDSVQSQDSTHSMNTA